MLETIIIEGGDEFTDDPSDSGGKTRWGVTEAAARAYGYKGEMCDLPMEVALDIGGSRYWDRMKLDLIHAEEPALAWVCYNVGYNCGTKLPIDWIQTFLNVNNLGGKRFTDQTVDGLNGRTTIETLQLFLKLRGDAGRRNLLYAIMSRQSCYYQDLAEQRAKDEKYTHGWLNRSSELFEDVILGNEKLMLHTN